MHAKRMIVLLTGIVWAGAALAHPGVPGHVHPEMTATQQLLHAAMNWAPVLVLAGIAGMGAMRAARKA